MKRCIVTSLAAVIVMSLPWRPVRRTEARHPGRRGVGDLRHRRHRLTDRAWSCSRTRRARPRPSSRGPEVERFSALKVGDKVTFRHHQSVVYAISNRARQPSRRERRRGAHPRHRPAGPFPADDRDGYRERDRCEGAVGDHHHQGRAEDVVQGGRPEEPAGRQGGRPGGDHLHAGARHQRRGARESRPP